MPWSFALFHDLSVNFRSAAGVAGEQELEGRGAGRRRRRRDVVHSAPMTRSSDLVVVGGVRVETTHVGLVDSGLLVDEQRAAKQHGVTHLHRHTSASTIGALHRRLVRAVDDLGQLGVEIRCPVDRESRLGCARPAHVDVLRRWVAAGSTRIHAHLFDGGRRRDGVATTLGRVGEAARIRGAGVLLSRVLTTADRCKSDPESEQPFHLDSFHRPAVI